MKKMFTGILLLAFLLTACGRAATVTQAPPPTAAAVVTTAATVTGSVAPTNTVPVVEPANTSDCTDSAAFVADVTVEDYKNFKAGDKFQKIWRVNNTGTCTWNSQYTLIFVNGNQMGAPGSVPLAVTKPGDTLDIAVDMAAPSTDAVYRADFEIHTPSGAAIPIDQNTILWTIITVGNATADSGGSGGNTGGGNTGGTGGSGLGNAACAYTANQGNVDAVIAAINAYRAQNDLPAYTVNVQLTQAAQSHSADMACNNLFVHTGSNGSTPQSRVAATGYGAILVTENVYGSYPPLTGQGAVNWWAADQVDPNHNKNLISTKYTEIGVGYSFFNNFGYYVVVFATR